jgi:hypothetical protein
LLGTVLLCLLRYDEAATAFQKSNEMALRSESFSKGIHLDKWGGSCWLAGDRTKAVSIWQKSVRGIADGTIAYADASGGIKNALLLWYGGVSVSDADVINEAVQFLKKASKRERAKNMPGPLAAYVLGTKPINEILKDVWDTNDLDLLLANSKTDTLMRRKLCTVLLCWATGERFADRGYESKRLMKLCSDLENPLVEIEWYLAHGEVGFR